jgi:hypothetical protein
MKRNAFNEPVMQPGDNITDTFGEHFGTDGPFLARFIEHDETFNWTVNVEDEEGNELQAHDFESEDAVVAWLTDQGVEIEQ